MSTDRYLGDLAALEEFARARGFTLGGRGVCPVVVNPDLFVALQRRELEQKQRAALSIRQRGMKRRKCGNMCEPCLHGRHEACTVCTCICCD
jgi:hypothetical protein